MKTKAQKRKEAIERLGRKLDAEMRGYRYAAGELLHSNGTAEKRLYDEIDADPSPFEQGMRDALLDWRAHMIDLTAVEQERTQ